MNTHPPQNPIHDPNVVAAHYPANSLQPSQVIYVQEPAKRRRGPHHVLHALLTLFTAGLWLPIWLLITMFSRRGD